MLACYTAFSQQWGELNDKGIYYYNKKNLKQAAVQFERGLKAAEQEFGTSHLNYVTACYNLASVYQDLNQPDKAIPLYKSYFSLLKELKGIDEEKAIELVTIGNYSARHKYYADAVIFWSEARNALAGDPEKYAIICSNLATGYKHLAQPDSAEVNLKQALIIYENIKGSCSNDYYENLHTLKQLYFDNPNYFSKKKLRDVTEQLRNCTIQLFGFSSQEYAQAVSELADVSLYMEDYTSGLSYLDECLSLVQRKSNVSKVFLVELMFQKGYALRELGRLQEGEEWVLKAKAVLEDEKAKYAKEYISALIRLSGFKILNGEIQEAERCLVQALELNTKHLKDDETGTIITGHLASVYFLKGNVKEAESLLIKYYNYTKSVEKESPALYYDACSKLGNFYYESGYYEKALRFFNESAQLAQQLFGRNSEKYATDCINLGGILIKLENFNEAEPVLSEAVSIIEKVKGRQCEEYASALFHLAKVYDEHVLSAKASELRTEAFQIYEQIFGRNHYKYARAASAVAAAYTRLYRFSEAAQLHLEALEIFKNSFGERQPDYARQCYELGSTYHDSGNFLLAEQWLLKAKSIWEDLFDKNNPDYGITLNALGSLYLDMGDYIKAEQMFTEAQAVAENNFGENHNQYLSASNNLGVLYVTVGQYDKAEQVFRKNLSVRESLNGKSHPRYAFACSALASTLADTGQYGEAGELFNTALSVIATTLGTDNLDYAGICENAAYYYNRTGQADIAERLYTESREVRAKYQGVQHIDYAQACNNLAYTKNKNGKTREAEELYTEARKVLISAGLISHSRYAAVCNNLASIYEIQHKYADAFRLFSQSGRVFINTLNSDFLLMPEAEREKYLEEFNYYRDIYFSFALDAADKIETAVAWAFRYNMLTKGALFRAAKGFREEIQNTTDTDLRKLFNEYQSLQAEYAKVLTLSEQQIKERKINPATLREQIAEAEKNLLRKSQILSRITADTAYTWKDVQKLLKPDEALVEWVRMEYYKNGWTDSVIYLAFIIRPQQSKPEYVVLGNGKGMEGREIKFYMNCILSGLENLRSYNIFWKPLEAKLGNVRKVYVVPDGIYHNLNLNTLYNSVSGKYLSDQYALHLLGSSLDLIHYRGKQFAQRKNYQQYKAYLFGYPDYTGKKEVQQFSAAERGRIRDFIRKDSTQRFFDLSEGHVTVLEGTRIEVNEINNVLRGKGIQAVLLTDQDASEKQLKQLRSPDILHIATHGFFLNNANKLDPDKQIRIKENPLMRSGLLLAGAELGLRGETMPSDEDGILFANEVQLLDLKDTELVVLSACETGLGEIKNGEGVYGLQRALQEAGVKNIVMSLWKVDDRVTQELMVQFYALLLSGKPKRVAFGEAQAAVRQKYPHPYYWGAFVLIGE